MYYDERRKYWLGGLLLILLAVALSAGWWTLHRKPPAIYGAIALSSGTQAYGTAWGYSDPAAAHARAQTECAKLGLNDCSVRVSLAGTCGALWRRSALGFAGVAFFAILAPSSSVVPVATQTMAEHRMYLPLAVVLALGIPGLYALAGRRALPGRHFSNAWTRPNAI